MRGDLFQAIDVPVLVMCPCWRGATSPAPQIPENRNISWQFFVLLHMANHSNKWTVSSSPPLWLDGVEPRSKAAVYKHICNDLLRGDP